MVGNEEFKNESNREYFKNLRKKNKKVLLFLENVSSLFVVSSLEISF